MTTQRVFVFIDGENLHKCARAMGYKGVDYVKIFWWLRQQKKAARIFLYAGVVEGDIDQLNKYKGLQKLGYETRLKTVMRYPGKTIKAQCKCPECKHEFEADVQLPNKSKANCDTELTLDVIRLCLKHKCSEIIVFSADGDFGAVYEHVVKNWKIKVSVYAPMQHPADRQTSTHLKELDGLGAINLYNLEAVLQAHGRGIK